MIKFLDSIPAENLKEKKVLLRVDFNVPVKEAEMVNGLKRLKIADDYKIKAHQETVDYLLENGAKILLVSHLDATDSFLSITEEIGAILGQTMTLVSHSGLNSLDILFKTSRILLLDNIRQDKREEKNSDELAKELAEYFDLYINDAFAVSHRNHALVASIAKFLSSYGGFLMKNEVENLSQVMRADSKGKVLVLGGAKISTKLPVIENFLDKAEKILIGGALANDFWQSRGIEVGASFVDDSVTAHQLRNGVPKLILPTDILVSQGWTLEKLKALIRQGSTLENLKVEPFVSKVKDLNSDEAIVDIGPQSAEDFAEIIKNAEIVIWNGPMGLSEVEKFSNGTVVVAKAVAGAARSIVGGGDTITAAVKLGLLDKFSYVSTGGGAMLEFLAGNRLPGLEALGYYE